MRAFGLLLLLCRGGATNASGGHEQWLYAKEGEPQQTTQSETWSDYWECSHDRTQSPIDIVTALALPDSELIGAIEPAIRRNHVRPTTYNHGFRLFHTSPNAAMPKPAYMSPTSTKAAGPSGAPLLLVSTSGAAMPR